MDPGAPTGVTGDGTASSPTGRVLAALDAAGVAYELIRIDPAHADTAAFCATYGYPPERSCNTIIVASKKEPKLFCACVVLATTQLDVNRRVRTLLGVPKASFASAAEMLALTGMELGAVTAFALPPDLPLFVDRRVMDLDWVILGGGGRDAKVRLAPSALQRFGARTIDDLAVERPGAGSV
jgi:prolyl-tRNA editing enzyme YbaK/EbsC (Cys-tRNA(Pro) deacylase)